jgi:hypothetical protein
MKWWIFAFLFIVVGCFKKKKYPSRPVIYFEDFIVTADSATITMKFEDGEGDIGLNDDQSASPYNVESKYYYNLYLVYYEYVNGSLKVGTDLNGDTLVFKNRLKPIYMGKPKSIDGKIKYTLSPFYYNFLSNNSDSIVYKIKIIDRALNESDWIETPLIVR